MLVYQDVRFVVNKSPHPLPKKLDIGETEHYKLLEMMSRRHLTQDEPSKGLKRLTVQERLAVEQFERAIADSSTPQWDSCPFPFEAAGKQGSCWELPLEVAIHLAEQHPRHLVVTSEEPKLPAGVTPRRFQTSGWRSRKTPLDRNPYAPPRASMFRVNDEVDVSEDVVG